MLLNYFEQIEGYKIYITSANIEGLVAIPHNAVKEEDFPLLPEKENYLRVFTNKWEYLPDYSNTILYNKTTKEEKRYKIGETPDLDSYTEVVPLENERFQKFENDKWVIDEEAIAENEKKLRIMELRKLLSDSDFRMTTDYYKRMTPENQTYWEETRDSWRTELRDLGV